MNNSSSPSVPCTLCGSGNTVFKIQVGVRNFYKCSDCGVVFLEGNKQSVNLSEIYESENYFQKESTPEAGHFGYNDYIYYQKFLEKLFSEHVGQIEKYTEKGSLLDVGCALGFLLNAAAKRGWKATGVDLNKYGIEYAKKNFNADARHCTLEDAKFADGSFEAVVMNDLIEHIPEPHGTIEEARRVLKKGGILMINTPNADSLSFKVLGKKWLHIIQNDHLFLFNDLSLTYLLQAHGFTLLKTKIAYKLTDLNVIADRLGYYNKMLEKFARSFLKVTRMGKATFRLKTGEILVFARKTS